MRSRNRAISTAIDVVMALALISASVMVLVVFLEGEDRQTQPIQADRAGETVMSTTFTVSYSAESVTEHDDGGIFESGSGTDDLPAATFERSTHGTVAGLLAEAAISNVEFWGEPLTPAGDAFESSIDGQFRSEVTGAAVQVRLDAVWRPFEGSGIVGHAEAGRDVPRDVDVNSVTITIPSGFANVSEEIREVRDGGDQNFNESATVVTRAVVDGLLPPEEMQRALERQGIDRKMAVYRYDRLSRIVSEYDVTMPSGYYGTGNLDKHEVNAWHLNDRLVGNLSTSVGSVLLGNGLSEPVAADMADTFDASIDGDELASKMTTGEVVIVIRTWETDELTDTRGSEYDR